MNRTDVDRLTWYILGFGVLATTLVYVALGAALARSAAVGVAVALANWLLLRFIVARVVDGAVRRKAAFSLVLFVKLGALMGIVFWLLYSGVVEPLAFTAGVSSLALGAIFGSLVHVLTASPAGSEP